MKVEKSNSTALHRIIELAFENAFKIALRRKNGRLPVWLFDLYNQYEKLHGKTNKNSNLVSSHINLAKTLYLRTYKELGLRAAKKLYGNKPISRAA